MPDGTDATLIGDKRSVFHGALIGPYAEEIFEGAPEDELQLMLGGNAIEYFHFDSAVQSETLREAVAAS